MPNSTIEPIGRRLVVAGADETGADQTRTLDDLLVNRAVVILAEPGMGKTVLLQSAKSPQRRYFRARSFLKQEANPNVPTVLIDGLDEARAGDRHGPTLEGIVAKLENFGLPQFVMTCRSGDWFGNADRSKIVENIGYDDLVIAQLLPLTVDEARAVAAQFSQTPDQLVDQALERGLGDLLLNPELIRLLADAVKSGWPTGTADLFRKAVAVQAAELNDIHSRIDESIATEDVIEAAGAICATYLIADSAGICRAEPTSEDSLWVKSVPAETAIATSALGRRLFSTIDQETYAPNHRTTAEYLAGRWIAKSVKTGVRARRVRALITGYDGGTLASLRGVFSWMCTLSDPQTAMDLVRTDPVGVVMQGDPRLLPDGVLNALLDALHDRARNTDPWFWGEYRADEPWGGISRPDLWPRFKHELADPDTPSHYKTALLDALTYGDEPPHGFAEILLGLATNSEAPRIVRVNAVETLAKCTDVDAAMGAKLFRDITAANDDYDLELRRGIVATRLGAQITDAELAALTIEATRRDDDSIGIMAGAHIAGSVAEDRLVGYLDALAAQDELDQFRSSDETSRAAFDAVRRLLKSDPDAITPERLLRWLPTFGYHASFTDEQQTAKKLRQIIQTRPGFQREYLTRALDGVPSNKVWNKLSNLVWDGAIGLNVDAKLVMDLTDLAGNEVDRAAEVFWFVARVASSAMPLPELDYERLLLLTSASAFQKAHSQLTYVSLSHVEKDRERKSQSAKKALKQKAEFILFVRENLKGVADGSAGRAIGELGQVAFGRNGGKKEHPTPADRLRFALGDEVSIAASTALQSLVLTGELPTIAETADMALQSRNFYVSTGAAAGVELLWRSPEIDRDTKKLGEKLGAARLGAVFIHHLRGGTTRDDLDEDAESVDDGLARHFPTEISAALEAFMRPLLEAASNHVEGSYALANSPAYRGIAAIVAPALLKAFPAPSQSVLLDLIHATWQSAGSAQLGDLAKDALAQPNLPDPHRVTWIAAGFLADPSAYETPLRKTLDEPGTRLHNGNAAIEVFTPGRRSRGALFADLNVTQLFTLVQVFGRSFPNPTNTGMRYRSRTGTEPHDFVSACITRIAGDFSLEAAESLIALANDTSLASYRNDILHATETRARQLREHAFKHSNPAAVAAAFRNEAPANFDDFAALLVGHLEDMSAEYQGGDTDGWKKFWNTDSYARALVGSNKPEEECRDRLLDDLRPRLKPMDVALSPEAHVSNDKEVDISASAKEMKLPIELKLETNKDLWTAPEKQLQKLYAIDPAAQGRGIYAVLWLGGSNMERSVPTPPEGETPATATELLEALQAAYGKQGLIQFVVLDGTPKKYVKLEPQA